MRSAPISREMRTEPPPPTLTPLPLPPPRLLDRRPAPGAEQALDAPIALTFDQPMDQGSVEAALTLSPTVEGRIEWLDERILSFVPENELARGNRTIEILDDRLTELLEARER